MYLKKAQLFKLMISFCLLTSMSSIYCQSSNDDWNYYQASSKSTESVDSLEVLRGSIQVMYIETKEGPIEKLLLITNEGRQVDLVASGVTDDDIKKFVQGEELEVKFSSKSKAIIEGGIEVEVGHILEIKQKKNIKSLLDTKISNIQSSSDEVRTFRVAFINLKIAGRGASGGVNSTFINRFKKSIEESTFGRIKIISSGRDIYSLSWPDGNCKQGPSIGSMAAREAIPDMYSKYDRVITHYPMEHTNKCTWSGIANIGSIKSPFSANIVSVAGTHEQVSIHEFGHSIGLGHSGYGSLNSDGKFIIRSTYGDKKCLMGNNNDADFFNPLHLEAIDVIKNNSGMVYGEAGKSYIISELSQKSLDNNEKVALQFGNFFISFDESPYILSVRRKVSRNAARTASLRVGSIFTFYESFGREVGIRYESVVDGRAQVSVGYLDELGREPFPLDSTFDSEYKDPAEFECVLKVLGSDIIKESSVGIKQKYSKMTLKATIEGNEFCTRDNARLRVSTLDNSRYGLKLDKVIDFRNVDFSKPYSIEVEFPFLRSSTEEELFTYMLKFENHSYFTKEFRKGHFFKNLTCDDCPSNSCEIAPQINLRAEKNGKSQLVVASNTGAQCSKQKYQVNLDIDKGGLVSYPSFIPQVNSDSRQLIFDIEIDPQESLYIPLTAKITNGMAGINKVTVKNLLGQSSKKSEHTSVLENGLINSSFLFGSMENTDPYKSRVINSSDVVTTAKPGTDEFIISKLKSIYLEVLNRLPKEEGLNYWSAQYKKGLSIEQIKGHISNSNEAKIRSLYLNHLDREPKRPGLEYWVGRLNDGAGFEDIKKHFRTIKECKKDCLSNSIDIVEELKKIYLEVLNRLPKEEGLNYWGDQYKNGQSLEQIKGHISNSNEAKVRSLYLNHLDREPDPSGLKYWVQSLDNGVAFEDLKKNFRTVKECKKDCL